MISNKQINLLLSKEYGLTDFLLKDLDGHIDEVFLVKTKVLHPLAKQRSKSLSYTGLFLPTWDKGSGLVGSGEKQIPILVIFPLIPL